jgi:hypothetical protein
MGGWAVGLAVAAVLLVIVGALVPGGTRLGVASGIAAGVTGVVAIRRDHERAVTVYAALVPLVFVVAFVLAELLAGHG